MLWLRCFTPARDVQICTQYAPNVDWVEGGRTALAEEAPLVICRAGQDVGVTLFAHHLRATSGHLRSSEPVSRLGRLSVDTIAVRGFQKVPHGGGVGSKEQNAGHMSSAGKLTPAVSQASEEPEASTVRPDQSREQNDFDYACRSAKPANRHHCVCSDSGADRGCLCIP